MDCHIGVGVVHSVGVVRVDRNHTRRDLCVIVAFLGQTLCTELG